MTYLLSVSCLHFNVFRTLELKNTLLRAWHLNYNDENIKNKFKAYQKTITYEINAAKKQFYSKLFLQKKLNTKNFWFEINKLLGRGNESKELISNIKYKNIIYKEPHAIANALNDHYVNIASRYNVHKADISNNNKSSVNTTKPYIHSSSMFLFTTTACEVSKIINNLKAKRVKDSHGLSSIMIKSITNEISPILTVLINKSFEQGIFPNILKMSKIIPIYKGKDKSDPINYRPISITSIISKIIEKIMHIRLYEYLNKYKLLNKTQYGYRKQYNTTYPIIDSLNKIYNALDQGNIACITYLDLSKAFDLVDHELLLNKLNNFGIRGTVNSWIRSYLENRMQFVQLSNNVNSDPMIMQRGVPQGSVLGPLLYILYINDYQDSNDNTYTNFYADDTISIEYGKDLCNLETEVNKKLEHLNNYFTTNRLAVNYEKTYYMIISNKVKCRGTEKQLNIEMGSHKLTGTDAYKYLGITIDNNLTWKDHIQNLCNKMKQYIPVFYKLRMFMNADMMLFLLKTYLNPVLHYGIEIFGIKSSTYFQRLQKLINKVYRIIYGFISSSYSNKTLQCYDIINMTQSRNTLIDLRTYASYRICKLVHKCIYDPNFPETFQHIFTLKKNFHHKHTRKKYNIFVPRINKAKAFNSFYYTGAIEWNKLPTDLHEINNHSIFCKELLKYYLNNYSND